MEILIVLVLLCALFLCLCSANRQPPTPAQGALLGAALALSIALL